MSVTSHVNDQRCFLGVFWGFFYIFFSICLGDFWVASNSVCNCFDSFIYFYSVFLLLCHFPVEWSVNMCYEEQLALFIIRTMITVIWYHWNTLILDNRIYLQSFCFCNSLLRHYNELLINNFPSFIKRNQEVKPEGILGTAHNLFHYVFLINKHTEFIVTCWKISYIWSFKT